MSIVFFPLEMLLFFLNVSKNFLDMTECVV